MASVSNEDYCLARVRQKLRDDGVKLWIAPYFDNNQCVELVMKVSVLFQFLRIYVGIDIIFFSAGTSSKLC